MPDPEFNLQHWLSVFPIQSLRTTQPFDVDGRQITSPLDLAIIEQLRKEAPREELGRGSPTDIFVFGKGEGLRRECTKIGGLPYRPADLRWPATHNDGRPMTFVGQLNFVKSQDIVGPLPGDVLLVFARNEVPLMDDPDAFRFEWYQEGIADLIRPDAVPEPAWRFVVCFGFRWRSEDLPSARFLFQEYESSWRIAVLEGTKIGGVPPFLDDIEAHGGMPGRFLASIGSIEPALSCPYPWINVPAPRVMDKRGSCLFRCEEELTWGDAGVLMLFLDDRSQIHWTIECY